MVTDAALAFHRRIDAALADAALRRAVAMTAGRLAAGRDAAFDALDDAEASRDEARRARAAAIARLDVYLDQFARAAAARGCSVHWAETAADARRIITGIARDRGVRLAVKSKSMATEEIELNDALEQAGVRVLETDLGEFIVQLAGDRPSHIITPIAHRSRQDVAALFREKLGATPEDVADIPSMTAFARRLLRAEFLQACMGISGVNLAVADSGSLCTVTNEGNGRLTTTLPRVHVALLGLERLVPTAADLASVLAVLARSATGQASSVYTNVMTGPRRRGEPDGPDELHVVILDNGRSRTLGTPLAEILYCVRCGACLNACPVYRLLGGHAYGGVYPGPVGSVVMPGLHGVEDWSELAQASSLCGACRDVCPVRIDLPHLILAVRREAAEHQLSPLWVRAFMPVYAAVATRPALYRWAGRAAARLARAVQRDGWISRLPGPLGAWTASRDFPAPSARSFVEEHRDRKAAAK
ncbi:MAG: LutB/LldF family L-lactate oxidation iron-sulfur protein [Vicinamibacterales bacterium]